MSISYTFDIVNTYIIKDLSNIVLQYNEVLSTDIKRFHFLKKHIVKNIDTIIEYARNVPKKNLLYMPMNFWFNNNTGLALPLVAMSYNEVKINIDFRDSDDLVC